MKIRHYSLLIIAALGISSAFALKEADRQVVDNPSRNILANPGAENGLVRWSVTGSGTLDKEQAAELEGSTSLKWNASASGEFLRSAAVPLPEGAKGRMCEVSLKQYYASGAAGDYKLQAYDGSNVLAEADLPVSASGISDDAKVLFNCPTSGNLQLSIESTADAGDLVLDRLYLGEALQISGPGAEIAIEAGYKQTSLCNWSIASPAGSGTAEAFPVDSDCPAPVVDYAASGVVLDTTDDDLPTFNFTSLPPGRYDATFEIPLTQSGSTANVELGAMVRDNTNSVFLRSSGSTFNMDAASLNGVVQQVRTTFVQTVAGPRDFEVYGFTSDGATAINIPNNLFSGAGSIEQGIKMILVRYPLESQKFTAFDQANHNATAQWTATANCLWEGTNTAAGSAFPVDSDCPEPTLTGDAAAPATKIPAMVKNNIAANDVYLVMANGSFANASDASTCNFYLHDGTNVIGATSALNNASFSSGSGSLMGVVSYPSYQASVQFEVRHQTTNGANACQIYANGDDRKLTMSVVNLSRLQAGVSFENMVSTSEPTGVKVVSAFVAANSGTPTVVSQDGTWIDSITDNGIGNYLVNFTAGTFTSIPHCQATFQNHNDTPASDVVANLFDATRVNNQINVGMRNVGTGPIDADFNITCIGK
jgi:hypothetical protein